MKPYLLPPPSLSLISHLSALERENPKKPQKAMRIRHSFSMRIHPSPSSPSSSSPAPPLSAVISLLPPEIQSEVSDLPFEDLEVLAYLMKRSLSPSQIQKKPSRDFEHYGSFWNRWDSSPNGNLISKAIDAYEESLDFPGAGDQEKKSSGKKKKDRKGKRGLPKRLDFDALNPVAGVSPEVQEAGNVVQEARRELAEDSPTVNEEAQDSGGTCEVAVVVHAGAPASPPPDMNRGLARKVLPDVVGFFNSRLWNLWRPKV